MQEVLKTEDNSTEKTLRNIRDLAQKLYQNVYILLCKHNKILAVQIVWIYNLSFIEITVLSDI